MHTLVLALLFQAFGVVHQINLQTLYRRYCSLVFTRLAIVDATSPSTSPLATERDPPSVYIVRTQPSVSCPSRLLACWSLPVVYPFDLVLGHHPSLLYWYDLLDVGRCGLGRWCWSELELELELACTHWSAMWVWSCRMGLSARCGLSRSLELELA